MPNTTTLNEAQRSPLDGTEWVRLATPGANWRAQLGSQTWIFGGGTFGSGTDNYPESEIPRVVDVKDGSVGTPITVLQPTMGISRQESLNLIDATGGQDAGLFVSVHGNNTSNNSFNAQVNGITSKVFQASTGTGDCVGVYSVATQSGAAIGTNQSTAYGGFFDATAIHNQSNGIGIEVLSANNTGVDHNNNSNFTNGLTTALDLVSSGANKCSIGIQIRKGGTGTNTWDSGIQFQGGSVATTVFDIRTSATNLLQIVGGLTYTTGIDMSAATVTTPFKSVGFIVTGTPQVIINQGSSINDFFAVAPQLQIGSGSINSAASFRFAAANNSAPYISFIKSRGTIATPAACTSTDQFGYIEFSAYDATATPVIREAAAIYAMADAAPTAGATPGRLVMAVAAAGAGSASEVMRLDSNGYAYHNITSAIFGTAGMTIGANVTNIQQALGIVAYNSGAAVNSPPLIRAFKTRATTAAGNTIVASGDFCFELDAYGNDGATYQPAATIAVAVDGTPAANNMPGRIGFYMNSGTTSTTERWRMDHLGQLLGYATAVAGQSNIDVSGQTGVVLANGANSAILPGSNICMVFLVNVTSGNTAFFWAGGLGINLWLQQGAEFVNSTTPAVGKTGIASNGVNIAIYNNVGSSQTYKLFVVRVGF
jgi:hypothetical protein